MTDTGFGDVYRCTYEDACNHVPAATVHDGSCLYPDYGYACDGSCFLVTDCEDTCGGAAEMDGCGECGGPGPTIECWDRSLVCNYEDCSSETGIGCTYPDACNYDPDATVDDGSCSYPDDGLDCDGECLSEVDCVGVCGGSAATDACGECDGPGPTVICMMSPDMVCDESECGGGGGETSGGGTGGYWEEYY
jgi:hypothetical protein